MKLMNMSYREDKVLSLAGDGPKGLDRQELQKQCASLVDAKMHGLCFSPYEEAKSPATRSPKPKSVGSNCFNRTPNGSGFSVHGRQRHDSKARPRVWVQNAGWRVAR